MKKRRRLRPSGGLWEYRFKR